MTAPVPSAWLNVTLSVLSAPDVTVFPLPSWIVAVKSRVVPDGRSAVLPVRLIWVAAPAVPVALKVSGEPVRPALVAVSVFAPAVVPRVQLPTVAMPEAFVVAEPPVSDPPPAATAKVTLTPATGLPCASVTRTLGAVATAVLTVADSLLPPLMAIVVAAPAT